MSIEKLSIESHHELEQMIVNEINLVEKGLTVICSNVPVNDKTTLDILCHDSNGQLVIIELSVQEDDVMLLQGLQSLDYVDKFKSFLKATYNKHKIDDKEKPRLILIAPSFSDAVKRAVESMKGIRIDLYEWEYLKLGDHKGLRLQPIFALKHAEKEEKPPEKKHEPKAPKKKEAPKKEPPPSPSPPPPPAHESKEIPKAEQPPKPEPVKAEPPKEEKPPPPPPAAPPRPLMEKPKEEPKRKLKLF
ncbi:MAG: endonuclease NucS [Candidatus Bathyarchaeota archaeon]|nr:endonuclease NucS [Candidatus Bathyarchaeota archaeon]MDW8039829.1 endonuclease NucS [Nitrososphaerota archaeon]